MNLDAFRGWMKEEDCVVVGCGPSASLVPSWRYERHWTISTNRSITFARADIACCVEPPGNDCWDVIRAHSPMIVIAHNPETFPRAIDIGKNMAELIEPGLQEDLRLGMCPFYAAGAAIALGFETIGLIGVDLTPDRFKAPAFLQACETQWSRICKMAEAKGRKIVNLNRSSRLKSVPFADWDRIKPKVIYDRNSCVRRHRSANA